jgi:hypothetical protein
MKPSNEIQRLVETRVTVLFEDILATLPSGCASLRTERAKGAPGPAVVLVPSNKQSAEFGAMVMDRDLYSAFFGRGATFTTFECPWELNLSRSAGLDLQLEVLTKMCVAVIAGRCEHRFERYSTGGVICVSEKEIYRVRDLYFWPRKNLEVVHYAPYYPGAESHTRPSPRLSL